MTVVPLPDRPCVRIKLDYLNADSFEAGSRFYFAYSGSAPTAANCVTLAGDIATAWNSHLGAMINNSWHLKEVDVLDIATNSGASGVWTGDDAGGDSGNQLPANVATNVEFLIARRYRGGKPRMFVPPPGQSSIQDGSRWDATFLTTAANSVGPFFAAIAALSVGAMGTLSHINLSYYEMFTNVTNSSGRTRAAPKYRATALSDPITGYLTKPIIGSQRRRRTATTY